MTSLAFPGHARLMNDAVLILFDRNIIFSVKATFSVRHSAQNEYYVWMYRLTNKLLPSVCTIKDKIWCQHSGHHVKNKVRIDTVYLPIKLIKSCLLQNGERSGNAEHIYIFTILLTVWDENHIVQKQISILFFDWKIRASWFCCMTRGCSSRTSGSGKNCRGLPM